MAFPTNPINNQVYTLGSNQFQYYSATSKWDIISTGISTAPSIAARATDPTTRDDGSALAEGDLYYNTADDAIKTYDGAAWNASGGGGGVPTSVTKQFTQLSPGGSWSRTAGANEYIIAYLDGGNGTGLYAGTAGQTVTLSNGNPNDGGNMNATRIIFTV